MKIFIGTYFTKEKQYALEMLFSNFLGFNVVFEQTKDFDHTLIVLDNSKEIIIEDHFFASINGNDYLNTNNIPVVIKDSIIAQLDNTPLLSLYGEAEVIIKEDKITIASDIIAATFFMLTRWEEHVIKERDVHNRFPASESLAVKHGFIDRPIVNEYVELLWNIIVKLDPSASRKKRDFNFLLTHDVDLPKLWWSSKDFIKSIGGAIIRRKNIKEAYTLTKQYITKKDPFNVFDWMMSLSEKYGFTSHFFFMSGGTSVKDNFYKIDHPEIKKLILEIKSRKHEIGFHPSFNAYNDNDQFFKELDKLKRICKQNINTGRHHFLRFENPTTWQIWENNGMQWDSTMSFHDREGFRCGVCYPFSVFNILTRKQLKLIERPLTVMEGSFMTYQNTPPPQMLIKIKKMIDTTSLYNGEFVFLWHNSAFRIKEYNKVYSEVLEYASKI